MYKLVFFVTIIHNTSAVLILYEPMLYASDVEMHVMKSKRHEQTPRFQKSLKYQVATK